MDVIHTALYAIIIVVIFAFIAVVSYIIFDYLEYKKQAKYNMDKTTADINYNFDVSSSNISKLYDLNAGTVKLNDRIIELNNYTSNTSNILTNQMKNTSLGFNNNLNNFHDNLNRYFTFNDGINNISAATAPNNKIYNYVFGTSIPNIELISKTTAVSGLTVKSSIDKELTVCALNDPNKCIKMDADVNGNFTLTPAGTNNIVFKNNDKTSVTAKFDTQNKAVFLGGVDEASSAMYIKENDVYIKSLKLIAPDLQNNKTMTYQSYYKDGIYTLCTMNLNPGTTANKYNTTIQIEITFDNSYKVDQYNMLYIDIPYIKLDILNSKTWNVYDGAPGTIYPFIKTELYNEKRELQLSKITYQNTMTFKFSNIQTILAGYSLVISIVLNDDINITTLTQPTNSLKFVAKSYFRIP